LIAGMARGLLEIEGLTVRYGGVLAVDDATLVVASNEAVGVVGPNGAGKTTTLRAIGGLLPFHGGRVVAGDVRFDGRTITGLHAAALVGRGIAHVLEGRRIFGDLTVAENLVVGGFAHRSRAELDARRREMLDLFPILGERSGQPGGLLSGGEQQMLAIARALMAHPRLLLLDEPSLGIAPIVVSQIAAALRRLAAEGMTVMVVAQDTALAMRATTRAYLMETGRVRAEGPTRELLLDDRVRASYLGTDARSGLLTEQAGAR
jgi:branched-chain amino acid transport system ATP-binding protein